MGAAAVALAKFGVGAGTSYLQYSSQKSAGKIQSAAAEVSASSEELGAKTREVDRKRRLAAALASQNAQAGAKGLAAFEGSPLTVLEADIASEKEATQRDAFQTKLRAESFRSFAKVREKQMGTSAAIGLLTGISNAAMQGRNTYKRG